MFSGKKFIAIIPARGGSKRLPGKNVKPLCGKSLVSWAIESAKKSSYIDTVVVSTNDTQVLSISSEYDVVTIDRPDHLSGDHSSTVDVLLHALDSLIEPIDYLVLLQPTSPLRTGRHIDHAIETMFEKKSESIVSVCECEHSPLWTNTLSDNGSMKDFIEPKYANLRSQDLDKYYRLNGAIYIINVDTLRESNNLLLDGSYAYIMNSEDSIDIDTMYDFICAESLLKYKLKRVT